MLDYTMALMADEGAGYVLSTSKSLDAELLRTQVRLAKRSLSMHPAFLLWKTSCLFCIVLVQILSNRSHGVQELALNACTTLVSVEPKLTMVTRDRVLQVSDSVYCTLLYFVKLVKILSIPVNSF